MCRDREVRTSRGSWVPPIHSMILKNAYMAWTYDSIHERLMMMTAYRKQLVVAWLHLSRAARSRLRGAHAGERLGDRLHLFTHIKARILTQGLSPQLARVRPLGWVARSGASSLGLLFKVWRGAGERFAKNELCG